MTQADLCGDSLFSPVQAHGLVAEDARVHLLEIRRDLRHKAHLVEHVFLQVDARRDLDEGHALLAQLKDRALGDVKHLLTRAVGKASREGDLPILASSEQMVNEPTLKNMEWFSTIIDTN